VIDATGSVVAPGFGDIHTRYDAQIFWDPLLSVSPWHGATTVVVGNCGFGVAPTRPEHRDLILRTLENVESSQPPAKNRPFSRENWSEETGQVTWRALAELEGEKREQAVSAARAALSAHITEDGLDLGAACRLVYAR